MQYEVQTVEDHQLPDGVDHVIVDQGGGTAVLLLSGRPAEVWAAMRAWEDSVEPSERPSICHPLRPVSRIDVPLRSVAGWQALARHARVG